MNEDHHPGRIELLPCPFCGNIDRLEVVPFDAEPYFPGFIVRCNASGFDGDPRKGCGCNTGWAETEAEAVDAWNRRAPDRALLDRIEELEGFVNSFHLTVLDNQYKDVTLHLYQPHALSIRIPNNSDKSWIFADLEARRKALSGEKP